MYKAKKFISYMALCVLIFSLCACGEKGSENAAIYGETVGGLEDNELFAIIDTNASLPVLLVTSQVYNDGLGNQAALMHIPQELRIRSRGTERHSASN